MTVPPSDLWLGLNEVQAVLITAAVAAAIALFGIFTQRSITARQTTIQYLRDAERDRDMIKARRKFQKCVRDQNGVAQWGTEANAQTEEARAMRMVLNDYELIAIGIQRGILDDTTYRRWHKSAVVKDWRNAAPYVIAIRTRTNNDALYHEFEEMARWYKGGPNMPTRRYFWRKFV